MVPVNLQGFLRSLEPGCLRPQVNVASGVFSFASRLLSRTESCSFTHTALLGWKQHSESLELELRLMFAQSILLPTKCVVIFLSCSSCLYVHSILVFLAMRTFGDPIPYIVKCKFRVFDTILTDLGYPEHENITILDLVTQAFNPATWEAQAVRQISVSLRLVCRHSEFQASQDYIENPVSKQNKYNRACTGLKFFHPGSHCDSNTF